MSPDDRELCLMWWLWRLGPRLFGDDAALFRCAWCNLDGEGSRDLCPTCCAGDPGRLTALDSIAIFDYDDSGRQQ